MAEYVRLMERSYFRLTTTDVRRLKYEDAEKLGVAQCISDNMAARDWLPDFMLQYRDLIIRALQPLSVAQIKGFQERYVT